MKITKAEAKSIPLQKFVEHLGGTYSHTDRKGDIWFHSPFRPEESIASFKINTKLNTWHDFGLSNTFAHHIQGMGNKASNGGDILDLWCDFNFKDRRAGFNEALQALTDLNWHERQIPITAPQRTKPINVVNENPRFKILKIFDRISFDGLKTELIRRRISLKVANAYLKQGEILDSETNKKYVGFLFENDQGGYEVSIPNPSKQSCFKTCIGPKAITRLLRDDENNGAEVFEGFWDFLSWLEIQGTPKSITHAYVLNSTSLTNELCEKVIAFKDFIVYVFLFMDNDNAGFQAMHNIAARLEPEDIKVGTLEHVYKDHKDLNDYWMSKPTLK